MGSVAAPMDKDAGVCVCMCVRACLSLSSRARVCVLVCFMRRVFVRIMMRVTEEGGILAGHGPALFSAKKIILHMYWLTYITVDSRTMGGLVYNTHTYIDT
jgi:hypothetical protein